MTYTMSQFDSRNRSNAYAVGMATKRNSEVTGDTATNVYDSDRPLEHLAEAEEFHDLISSYLSSAEGRRFTEYVHSQGREYIPLVEFGAADLGDKTVAATIHNGLEARIVGNYDGQSFQSRVQQMAALYNVNEKTMREYVFTHELAHAAGYQSEAATERFIKNYFTARAFETYGEQRAKYASLARIAAEREAQAAQAESSSSQYDSRREAA